TESRAGSVVIYIVSQRIAIQYRAGCAIAITVRQNRADQGPTFHDMPPSGLRDADPSRFGWARCSGDLAPPLRQRQKNTASQDQTGAQLRFERHALSRSPVIRADERRGVKAIRQS